MRTRTQIYSSFGSHLSLPYVARNVARTLQRRHKNVSIWNTRLYYSGRPVYEDCYGIPVDFHGTARNGILVGYPPDSCEWLHGHEHKIGLFACEASRIPERWAAETNKLDILFVPSEFCKQSYSDSGTMIDIQVMHHGLENCFQPLCITPKEPFSYFMMFSNVRFCRRKSVLEAIKAFSQAFPGDKDVRLVLRCDDTPWVKELIKRYALTAQTVIMDGSQSLPPPDVSVLLQQHHVLLHPSRGEGFGLIALQAQACGVPVIMPNETGMREFFRPNIDLEVKAKDWTRIRTFDNNEGRLPNIDVKNLAEVMRDAKDRYSTHQTRALVNSIAIRYQFAWHRVIQPLAEVV